MGGPWDEQSPNASGHNQRQPGPWTPQTLAPHPPGSPQLGPNSVISQALFLDFLLSCEVKARTPGLPPAFGSIWPHGQEVPGSLHGQPSPSVLEALHSRAVSGGWRGCTLFSGDPEVNTALRQNTKCMGVLQVP
jgi:hypothetical protein